MCDLLLLFSVSLFGFFLPKGFHGVSSPAFRCAMQRHLRASFRLLTFLPHGPKHRVDTVDFFDGGLVVFVFFEKLCLDSTESHFLMIANIATHPWIYIYIYNIFLFFGSAGAVSHSRRTSGCIFFLW